MTISWEKEALSKFESGEWKPVPWHKEVWFVGEQKHLQHYTHINAQDNSQITYVVGYDVKTDSFRTRTGKPGRYLTKFYNHVLPSDEIRSLATKFIIESSKSKILFAKTPDEIEKVYINGPNSCMSATAEFYMAEVHPTRVYGAGDLAIAYIKNYKDRVISRTLCWPEKKVFSRIYGDGGDYDLLLEKMLKSIGWSQFGNTFEGRNTFEGAKCLKIPYGGGYVAPYLDYEMGFDVEENYLIIKTDVYEIKADSETGVIGLYCEKCGDPHNSSTEYEFEGLLYCQFCWYDIAFTCAYCDDVYSLDQSICVEGRGQTILVCEFCCADSYSECKECNMIYKNEFIMKAPNDDLLCSDCWDENVGCCEECTDDVMSDDIKISEHDDLGRCEACHSDHLESYEECKECGAVVEKEELVNAICGPCEEDLWASAEENLRASAEENLRASA